MRKMKMRDKRRKQANSRGVGVYFDLGLTRLQVLIKMAELS